MLLPQLLDGARVANAPRLAQVVSDYKLIGQLAFTYGRVEELRYRICAGSQQRTSDLDPMTAPLADPVALLAESVLQLRRRGGSTKP